MAQVTVLDLSVYGAEINPKAITVLDIPVYAVDGATVSVNVRASDGFVLRDDPKPNKFRQGAGYVSRGRRKPDFSKSAKDALLLAVNKEWGMGWSANSLQFLNPVVSASTEAFNSWVTIKPVVGSNYGGQVNIRYDRYALEDAFAGKNVGSFVVSATSTVWDLLPTINSQFNLALTQSDVQQATATANQPLTLQAGTASLYFMPGGSVILGS